MTKADERQRRTVGREVLGPLFARFSHELITWSRAVPDPKRAALLFAARGGLRLKFIVEAFSRATGYRAGDAILADLMVSRLAVNRAFLARTPAAREEMARYCRHGTLGSFARLITFDGGAIPDHPGLDRPVTAALIAEVLADDTALSSRLMTQVREQERLLLAHLEAATGGRDTVLFVDTGLFGSTFHVVQGGMPQWKCAVMLLGRCIYREAAKEHVDRTFGMLFQNQRFSAAMPASAILRHWYMIEALLEPDISSVVTYAQDAATGAVQPDGDSPAWRSAVEDRKEPLYDGLLSYIEDLHPHDLLTIDAKATRAARRLAQMILMPGRGDVDTLDTGALSPSPGEDAGPRVLIPVDRASMTDRLRTLREARWREGQLRLVFPRAASALLPVLATSRALRGLVHAD